MTRGTREPGDNIIEWFNKVASDLVQGHLFLHTPDQEVFFTQLGGGIDACKIPVVLYDTL
ncbi:hypothetical protein D5F53_23775 [Paenibacillus lautus]|uniref:Uncharacterized protein n=1 Tax=Paenibacillus lautus TaxID=1401 RepID=A0A385TQX4_PAELA|nr:hypothetical protein D5F53_23775 [Paenibacillus lautus]